MPDHVMPDRINSIIRHLLTFFGGAAVTKGWIDEVILEALIGAIVAFIGSFWSITRLR